MAGLKIITNLIRTGLKSSNLISNKVIGNNTVQLFRNSKTGKMIARALNKETGLIRTFEYNGTRKVYGVDGKPIPLYEAIGKKTLSEYPEALALNYVPDKATLLSVNPALRYKATAQDGIITRFYDFFGKLIKGTSEKQSVSRFVQGNPFIS